MGGAVQLKSCTYLARDVTNTVSRGSRRKKRLFRTKLRGSVSKINNHRRVVVVRPGLRTSFSDAVCFLAAGSQRRLRRSVNKKKNPSRTTKPALLWKCRLSRRHLCMRSAIRIHIARRNDADFQSAAGCRAAPAPASGGLGRCIKQALELSQ